MSRAESGRSMVTRYQCRTELELYWFCSSLMIAMIEDLGPVLVQKFSSSAHNYQAESVGQQV